MKNYHYTIIVFVFILINSNKVQSQEQVPKHTSFKIESSQVGETRVITVWTPPSYESSTESFPVLYMPDGGIKEDFPHIAYTVAKLVANKSIPPMILVGIENTQRGRDLTGLSEVSKDAQYCPLSDGAKNFRAFITEELFPAVNDRYRVTDKKGIIGESLAGLFVIETFMQQPDSFDFYIAMDPSLWWNNHFLVRNATTLLKNFPSKEVKLWFAGSSAEDISQHTNELAEILHTHTPGELKWKYSEEPNEQHNTIFRATKDRALKWIFND
jgi:predicted alpha/beta superfamily hydrolase